MPAIRSRTAAGCPWCRGVRLRKVFIWEQIPHFGKDPPKGLALGHPLDIRIIILEPLEETINRGASRMRGERDIWQRQ
jgi:hypothetical protein